MAKPSIIPKKAFILFAFQSLILLISFFILFSLSDFSTSSGKLSVDFDSPYFSFALVLISLFLIIELIARKKLGYYKDLSLRISSLVSFTFKKKYAKAKDEKRIPFLLFLELLFSVFIAYSFFIVLDAEAEFLGFLDWSHLPANIIPVAKIMLFLLIVAFILWIYNKTKEFRTVVLDPSPKDKLVKKIKQKLKK